MIEFQIARFVQWLDSNTKIIRTCPLCASGMRVEKKGFWRYAHPPNKTTGAKGARCKSPSYWIYYDGTRKQKSGK